MNSSSNENTKSDTNTGANTPENGASTINPKATLKFVFSVAALLCIIYSYPRFLVHMFGEASPWTSYFYLYGFGFIFFIIGVWIALKSGSCRPKRGRDGFWLKFTFFGYVWLASMHAAWIWLALSVPFRGE